MMLTLKLCFESGPVWIAGVTEIHTQQEAIDANPHEWMLSDAGRDALGGDGMRVPGRFGPSQSWTLLIVRTGESISHLAAPTGFTFILNDSGATIDRI